MLFHDNIHPSFLHASICQTDLIFTLTVKLYKNRSLVSFNMVIISYPKAVSFAHSVDQMKKQQKCNAVLHTYYNVLTNVLSILKHSE